MARNGIGFRVLAGVALAACVLIPAFATEESAKEKPAEKTATETQAAAEKDAKTAEAKTTEDAAECKPTATRVNTLEDVFGIANWLTLQQRVGKPAPPVTQVTWHDATAKAAKAGPADAKPTDEKAATR